MHMKYLDERETLDIKCTILSTEDQVDWTRHTGEAGGNQELPTPKGGEKLGI